MDAGSSPRWTDRRSSTAALPGQGSRTGRHALFVLLAATFALSALSACGGSGKSSAGATSSTTSSSSSPSTTSTTAAVTGSSTAPGVVSASAAGVSATLHAGSHTPTANVPWPISFVVTKDGTPTQAKVEYEYLFAGVVVAKRSNYTFRGHFSDHFLWPGAAVGHPLTFRAVIAAAGQTLLLDYPVQVAR
jgi:ABC-type phosphate transport system substrate-binding protein